MEPQYILHIWSQFLILEKPKLSDQSKDFKFSKEKSSKIRSWKLTDEKFEPEWKPQTDFLHIWEKKVHMFKLIQSSTNWKMYTLNQKH